MYLQKEEKNVKAKRSKKKRRKELKNKNKRKRQEIREAMNRTEAQTYK